MGIDKILEFINREVPSHAEEIWSAIDLLSNTIENTRCAVDGSIGKLSSNREYEKANDYMKMSQNLAEILDKITEYSKTYVLQDCEEDKAIVEDDEEDIADSSLDEKVNYEKYRVDEEVAYNLYTDFTHKKLAAFSLNGKKYPSRKWQYLFIQTCEILVDRDYNKFNAFAYDQTMQGRTRSYFSKVESDIGKPKKINGTDIFVETNLSANNIRNIVVTMLEKYNIPKNQYQIYLSKDLTPLHRDGDARATKTESVSDSDEDSHTLN